MRTIDPIVIENLKAEFYRPAVLMTMNISGDILRYTTWQTPIMVGGFKYVPLGMSFNAIRYGIGAIVDTVDIKIDDVNKNMYNLLSPLSNDNMALELSLAVLDRYETVLGTTDLFKGSISGWAYSPGATSIKGVSIFEQWGRVSVNLFSSSCRWTVFGGAECTYSVSPGNVCDRTYTTCQGFNNTANFGGFRWTPTLIDKTLDPKGIPVPPVDPAPIPRGVIR
jgi:hypothetical protein